MLTLYQLLNECTWARLLIPCLDEKCEKKVFKKTFLSDSGNDTFLLYKILLMTEITVVDFVCLHLALLCFSCLDERLTKILTT